MFKFILLAVGLILSDFTQAQQKNIRGMRVDPGYFYNLYSGLSATEICNKIALSAKANGANTLFIYAYSSTYGAYYPTTYKSTAVENSYGKINIFKKLTLAAKKNNLKVVAVVPVNNFKQLWKKWPSWRAKNKFDKDYVPTVNSYLLSAWHPKFKTWLSGFYKDFIRRNPDIDGIEAVEPFIDYKWANESDYNLVAKAKFKKLYPAGKFGKQIWLKFRAQGLTNLIGIMNSTAHAFKKETFLVQTWPVKSDGNLYSSEKIRDNLGLDLNGILNLNGKYKLNYLMAELIWQQWAAEHGGSHFNPDWTRRASMDFISILNSRSIPLVHVEITPFTGPLGEITPTPDEFASTLLSIRDLNVGIDVYDHSQIAKSNIWKSLLSWN